MGNEHAAAETHWLSVAELGERYRSGDLDPVAVTHSLLERARALEERFHAYATMLSETALDAAESARRELESGVDRGALHGVPVAVKDLCAVRGIPTGAGTTVLRDRVASEDACIVARLREAGAIILGTLSMTEGAYGAHHPAVPPPVNPWNADRWPGVSSSGSGVATSAGLCTASLGSDTGGSIRFPSAVNGVVGLKPTYGRVPRHGVFPLGASLDHVGPITRRARDAGIVLAAIGGPDPRDPTSLGGPAGFALEEGSIEGLRIGIDERWITEGMDPEVTGLVLDTIDVFRRSGAVVREVHVPATDDVVLGWGIVTAAEAAIAHEGLFPERAEEYGTELREFLELGRAVSAVDYAKVHAARLAFVGRLANLFEEVDILLCPSLGIPTPARDLDMRAPEVAEMTPFLLRFTAPFDFSGSPTLSLPCGFTGDGMPASLQLVGRSFEEATLVRAGEAFEERTEWHLRRPPV